MSYQYFLKIDGVTGESKDPLHPGSIEFDSVAIGQGRTPHVGSGSAGGREARLREIVVFKRSDSTSSLLFHAASNGRLFAEATLTIERTFLGIRVKTAVIKMRSVYVDSVSQRPGFDEIVLNFDQVQFQHGSAHAVEDASRRSWDVFQSRGS